MSDQVTLVNELDQVIGFLDKVEAHRGQGQLHRAISVFLFRKKQGKIEILLQQRSLQKIVGGGQWANTVCGNVWPGESYEACAQRRLAYELGIQLSHLTHVAVFRYQVPCNELFSENEIDHVFAAWYEGTLTPNPAEVIDYQWVDWEEVLAGLSSVSMQLAPWATMLLADSIVSAGLQKFIAPN